MPTTRVDPALQVYAAQCHTSSVNSCAFAPHELGLQPRPDVRAQGLTQAQALANAPAQEAGCFLTPRVIG